MNKMLKVAALVLLLCLLSACDAGCIEVNGDMSTVKMTAQIKSIDEYIEVEVIEGEYGASGIYWVIVGNSTKYYDADGEKTNLSSLCVGDTVEIGYGGQVMMSYPPQIVAKEVKIVK